jgi:hypothetical protein
MLFNCAGEDAWTSPTSEKSRWNEIHDWMDGYARADFSSSSPDLPVSRWCGSYAHFRVAALRWRKLSMIPIGSVAVV